MHNLTIHRAFRPFEPGNGLVGPPRISGRCTISFDSLNTWGFPQGTDRHSEFQKDRLQASKRMFNSTKGKVKKKKKKPREIESQLAGSIETLWSCRGSPERLKCKAQWVREESQPL